MSNNAEIAAHDEGGPYACSPAKLDYLFSSSGPAHSGRTRGEALKVTCCGHTAAVRASAPVNARRSGGISASCLEAV